MRFVLPFVGRGLVTAGAITFVGSTFAGNAQTALSPTLPTTQEGDFVLVLASNGSNANLGNPAGVPTPTGYTAVANTGTLSKLHAFYKFMGSTPDTSVSVANPGAVDLGVIVFAFRGVSSSNPIDVTAVTSSSAGDPSAITPVTPGAMVVATASIASAANTNMLTAGPTGYDNFRNTNAHFFQEQDYCRMAAATKLWTSGVENPSAFSPLQGTQASITLALRPS